MILENERTGSRSLDDQLEEVQSTCHCPICNRTWEESVPKITVRMLNGGKGGPVKMWCSSCQAEPSLQPTFGPRPEKPTVDEWSLLCPWEFRLVAEGGRTDPERLRAARGIRANDEQPMTAEAIVRLVDSSVPVLLAGTPGTMKTRLAWRMARRVFDRKKTVHCFSSWQFQASLQDAGGRHESLKWMKSLTDAELVVIDDLGKAEWTGNTHGGFFELLDARASNHRSMVITTNESFSTIQSARENHKSQTAQSTGPGIIRRLREYAVTVVMQP